MGNTASRLVALLLLVFGVAAGPSARADDPKPEPKADPKAEPKRDQLPKTQLLQGPSLRETGRVAPMLLQGGGVEIQRRAELDAPKENSVQQASTMEERPQPQPRAGVVDRAVLERQIKARFSAAQDCRTEVGRRKQVSLRQVTAGPLTLRWTILPTGEVAAAVVVLNSPTDVDLVDCVKRRLVTWTFTRPRGGSVNVERTLNFR